MCGIVGYVDKTGRAADRSIIEAMTSTLSHRGPHGNGIYTFRNVSIGHRRLAIIDLDTGTQPMSNEDDTIWITYNGELYNYKELRKILEQKGHTFKTHSDTEVIIHAYEEWGKRAVEYFRGMFAFGIIDTRNFEIFLARDHIGIKPLVYVNNSETFAFSSELQAFYALPAFDARLNINALDQYLTFRYIPAPLTVYHNTCKLLPAHRMAVSFDGDIKYIENYWDIRFKPDTLKTEDDWLEELDHRLRDSVKKHLIADVPVGALLSGGIDSTLIVKYMTELQGENSVQTFSIGFPEDQYSELPYTEIVNDTYKTDQYSKIISPDSIDILPALVKHYGEPFGDDSCIPTYYLSQFASEYVTVVLSGDGGDELFCGYTTYEKWLDLIEGRFLEMYKKYPWWKKFAYIVLHHTYTSRYPYKYYEGYDPTVELWIEQMQNIDARWKKKLWKNEFHRSIDGIPDTFKEATEHIDSLSPVHMAQYLDMKTLLPSRLLPKVDIVSMMNGLEVRTPFADKEILEFACTIPDTVNLKRNDGNTYTGKYLLKKLLSNDFNNNFIYRNKTGFNIPIYEWFSVNGNKRRVFEEYLLRADSHISEYFRRDAISALFKHNKIRALWALLFLEIWLEHVYTANKKRAH